MAKIKPYRQICIILFLICLLIQASLFMPILSQDRALDNFSRQIEPSFIAPLSQCDYTLADKSKESYSFDEILYSTHPFPGFCLFYLLFALIPYQDLKQLSDDRVRIKKLITSQFNGSRYKDVEPPFLSF